jgi:hypothetical protein
MKCPKKLSAKEETIERQDSKKKTVTVEKIKSELITQSK